MAVTYDALLRIIAKATGAGEVKNLSNAIGGLTKSAAGLGAIAGTVTGLGVALSGVGLAAGAKNIIDMADSLDELSQRSGASAENLSKLGAAARMSGLDTEQVSAGLVKLSKNLGEIAAGGGKDAKAALDQLGVSAFNASGELRKPDEVMFDLIDSLARMENGGEKTRLSMELLGKSGAALIPMFNMGSEAIKNLNTGISNDFAKNAGEYNDRMAMLGTQFTALGVTILDQLLPSMIKGTEFIGGLISSAQGWLKENEGALGAFVKGMASAAVEAGKIAGPILVAVAAYQAYRGAVAAAVMVQGLFNAVTIANPVGLLAMAAGLGIGAVAMAKIAAEMKKAKEEGDRLGGSSTGFAKALKDAEDNLEGITAKQQASAAAAEQQRLAAEALRKTEEDRTYWLERAGSAYQKQAAQIDLISAANQRRTALAGEENTLAQAYNNLGKTILQNRLELAKTDEEKLAISKQIAQIESESARLQLEATKLQIQAEQELKAAALNRAISNRKEIESTMALAAAMYNAGQIGMDKIQNYRQELDKARRAADTAQLEFNQAQRINNVKTQAANINYQASVLQATGEVPASANAGIPAAMGGETPRRYTTIAGIRIPEYAKGGYVTRPTLAMIGEGGEPEYVVPKSKALVFAGNILKGNTGSMVLNKEKRTTNELRRAQYDYQKRIRQLRSNIESEKVGIGATDALGEYYAKLSYYSANRFHPHNRMAQKGKMRIPQYAKGGYVTRPTLAEIGEGGEPEYVVPKSKAKAFANNIAGGAVGGSALSSSGGGGGGGASSTRQYGYATDRYGNKWSLDPAAYRGKSFKITAYDTSEEVGSPRWQIRMSQMKTGTTSKKSTFSGPGGGSFTIQRPRSLAGIRSDLQGFRQSSSGARDITINTRVDKVIRQDGEDRITLAQAQKLASESARQAVAQMDSNLKSPTYRQKLGIR